MKTQITLRIEPNNLIKYQELADKNSRTLSNQLRLLIELGYNNLQQQLERIRNDEN